MNLMSNFDTPRQTALGEGVNSAPDAKIDDRLRHLNRLADLGMLSASMAHEIKNALVAGKTFVEMLLENHKDTELAGTVRRELDRIDSLVSQMLRFSASRETTFGPVRVHELLEHSLRLVQSQLEEKSIVLERRLSADSDLIKGDQYQLQQAFVNLLLNALEAMGSNGILTIGTEICAPPKPNIRLRQRNREKQLRVTFADTGIGIAPENQKSLFEPFYTTKSTGTGLGLSITRGIIEEHGGTITVQSELKKGSKFAILLPALRD
jgi:signal transduction histidine kinase